MEFETSLLTSSLAPTIASTASPLEVLSNAAALIETKSCEDQPLDMSIKKKNNNEKSESDCERSPPPYGYQSLRPSVITCASTLLKSQSLSSTSQCHNCCTNENSGHISDNTDSDSIDSHSSKPKSCKRHRKELVSEEISDPVIEEHFRRSLGNKYSLYFTDNANDTSLTCNSVDDHFAKALGDDWVRIKKTKLIDESSKSNNTQSIVWS